MSFEELMQELQKEYLADLPGRVQAIQSAFDRASINEIREDFHKLKGTGRTYGIPEISDLAGAMEQICIRCPDQVGQVIPSALAILHEIHLYRTAAQAFDILSDKRFSQIKRLSEECA